MRSAFDQPQAPTLMIFPVMGRTHAPKPPDAVRQHFSSFETVRDPDASGTGWALPQQGAFLWSLVKRPVVPPLRFNLRVHPLCNRRRPSSEQGFRTFPLVFYGRERRDLDSSQSTDIWRQGAWYPRLAKALAALRHF